MARRVPPSAPLTCAVRQGCSDVAVRAMFLTYLLVIASGLILFMVIGLTHH